jgi:branched-chain amino acid transport system substrate-binding protein
MSSLPRSHRAHLIVVLLTWLVAGASCGSSGNEDSGATTSLPGSGSTGTAYIPTSADDEGETVADLEVEWAANRARVVAELTNGAYGLDEEGDDLSGPGGFELDLDQCPSGWDDKAGLDGGSIKIGVTAAQSGELAAFGDLAVGMQAYFDYVNANGGIEGVPIELSVKDDAYDATLTADLVDELIDESAFYVTNVGSPGALAAYDALNDDCVPQPFVASPHPALGDPADHPFTTGLELSYLTEAVLWGTWIKQNLGEHIPVSVGALVIDNDFGQIYADSFDDWADSNPDIVSSVTFVRHDPQVSSVADEMAEIAEDEPDVFLSMTSGDACLSALQEATAQGVKTRALAMFTPLRCSQPALYMAPAGAAADGFYVVGAGVKSSADPVYAEDTFVRFVNDQLAAAGFGDDRPLVGVGFAQYGWAHVEILRLAAALPGGLSRSNVVLALRAADLDHPMLLDGVRFVTEGDRDAFFIEGAQYSRYDAEAGAWFQQGPAVDLNGSSPTCRWDDDEGRCG